MDAYIRRVLNNGFGYHKDLERICWNGTRTIYDTQDEEEWKRLLLAPDYLNYANTLYPTAIFAVK